MPEGLQDIINNEEKRKKLVLYINPPYAEATTSRTVTGTGSNKAGTATENKINKKYKNLMGNASNELFTQFLFRIFKEIPSSTIANFSTLKNLQSSNFTLFRQHFKPKLERVFLVPADTFDNVKGKFPIGFFIWNGQKEETFTEVLADVYDGEGERIGDKVIHGDLPRSINKWFVQFQSSSTSSIGILTNYPPDFQNQGKVFIQNNPSARSGALRIASENLVPLSIYFAVRHCIEATWLNDRDQFLYPLEGWRLDKEFQADCLAFTLFHGQNRLSAKEGTNHWIPFSETQVKSQEKFDSDFMSRFLSGKVKPEVQSMFSDEATLIGGQTPVVFSTAAQAVFDAGLELWRYYHAQPGLDVNASLYDIRAYFQGRNEGGKMNTRSADEEYNITPCSLWGLDKRGCAID